MFLNYWSRSLARVLVAFAFIVSLSAQQSSAPQDGVYNCTNGFILTISRCGKVQGVDACYFNIENKGQVLMDTRGSLDGVNNILAKCKDPAEAAQTGTSKSGPSAARNPAYLSEMPPPDRILAEIKGKDVEDTGERQMGAFRALVQMIDDMAWGLGHRYVNDADSRAATPDERRLRFGYETAYADLWHKVTNKEGQVYDHDVQLRNELLSKFFSENFRAQYFQSNKNEAAEYKAFQEKMSPTPAATNQAAGSDARPGMASDAGSLAVHHCIESGRSQIECITEGFKVGMGDLAGKDSILTKAMQDNKDPGLRVTGVYSAADAGMMFSQDRVKFSCGGLMSEDRLYSVQLSGTQVKVTIASAPKPLVFSYKDGKIEGPGAMDVAGRVQTGGPATNGIGYKSVPQRKLIDSSDVSNYPQDKVHFEGGQFYVDQQITTMQQTQTAHYEIPSEPKTVRCNIGVVSATAKTAKIADITTTVLGSEGSKSQNTAPGLRMNGTYAAQGGLKIEFRADSATIECGEARNSEGYAVVPESGRLVVKFQNGAALFILTLQPNGTLAGSGSVEVNGRIVTGHNGNEILYAQRNERCSLGTLAPNK